MKGLRVCKQCLDDLKSGTPIPNLELYDPDNTLRDILKFCVPHMNLHNLSSLSLCSACVEILQSLEEHVTKCTKLEDIHEGKIPEDIDDFVKYCMRSFTIAAEPQVPCDTKQQQAQPAKTRPVSGRPVKRTPDAINTAQGILEGESTSSLRSLSQQINSLELSKHARRHGSWGIKRKQKRDRKTQKERVLRRPRSLDSILSYQTIKRVKMPMLCGHYLNSMLSSEIEEKSPSKCEL